MTPCNNHRCGMQPPSRRTVVGMLAAIGAGTALGLRRSAAQTTASSEDWIVDTHHHIYPPRYATANLRRIMEDSGGVLPASAFTNWSPRLALEQMDKAGVRSAVVSMTSPSRHPAQAAGAIEDFKKTSPRAWRQLRARRRLTATR